MCMIHYSLVATPKMHDQPAEPSNLRRGQALLPHLIVDFLLNTRRTLDARKYETIVLCWLACAVLAEGAIWGSPRRNERAHVISGLLRPILLQPTC